MPVSQPCSGTTSTCLQSTSSQIKVGIPDALEHHPKEPVHVWILHKDARPAFEFQVFYILLPIYDFCCHYLFSCYGRKSVMTNRFPLSSMSIHVFDIQLPTQVASTAESLSRAFSLLSRLAVARRACTTSTQKIPGPWRLQVRLIGVCVGCLYISPRSL